MGGPGSGRKPTYDDEYHREHRRRVAESRARVSTGGVVLTRLEALGIDEDELYACVLRRMEDHGESEDEAREKCEEQLKGTKRYAEGEPKYPASDGLQIVGREATQLERCMSLRMDMHGEDEVTARRTCTRMFNDPLIKKAFDEDDGWKMGEALFNWELKHSPRWADYRERRIGEKRAHEKAIDAIIEEIRQDIRSTDRFLPDSSLREKAEDIYRRRRSRTAAERRREARDSLLTVGHVKGKTKEQIIAEQRKPDSQRLTVGTVKGTSKADLVEDYREWQREQDRLKRARRRRVE